MKLEMAGTQLQKGSKRLDKKRVTHGVLMVIVLIVYLYIAFTNFGESNNMALIGTAAIVAFISDRIFRWLVNLIYNEE